MVLKHHRKLVISTLVVCFWFGGTAVLWAVGGDFALPLGIAWMFFVRWVAVRLVAYLGWQS